MSTDAVTVPTTTATPLAPSSTTAAPAPASPPSTTVAPAPTPEERRALAHRAGHGDADAFAKWMGMDAAAAQSAAPPAAPPTPAPTPAQPEAETGRVRGEGGKFVKADGTPADATTTQPTTEATPPAEKPAAERPGDRTPGLALLDAEGQPLDVDAGTVKVRAKIGGEDVELPLGDVLRRASGQAGAQRHAARLEQELGTMQTTHEQLRDQFEDLRVLGIRLAMGDVPETELAELRASLSASLSPSALAEQRRQDERDARERQRTEQDQESRASTATELVPVLAGLLRDHPQVTEEEINGKLMADTARWCAPGSATIKPEHLGDFRAYLTETLPRFVRQRQGERAGTAPTRDSTTTRATTPPTPATPSAADPQLRRAQEEAQRAKNILAEAVRPSGALPVEGGPPKKPTFRNINDRAAYAVSAFENVGR
jgi:hypothetical protein